MARTKTDNGKTVVETMVAAIRDGILGGLYAPGQRLIEADLTRDFNVSRGPLREALGRLAADSLVEIEPYRGAIVARPSRQDVSDTLQLREVLEGLAARLAAERINLADNRKRAKAVQTAILRGNTGGEFTSYVEDNERFHRLIFELSGNHQIGRTVAQLQLPTLQAAFFRMLDQKRRADSLTQHAQILGAILDGDGPRAEKVMRAHVARTAELAKLLPDALFGS